MLIEGQEALQYLSHSIYNFGEVGPKDKLEFEIDWYRDREDIEYIMKGCGCTAVYYENGRIKGTLDMERAGRFENVGVTPVQKTFTVWLKDGQPHFRAANEKLEFEQNPEKGQIRVTLFARVVIEEPINV